MESKLTQEWTDRLAKSIKNNTSGEPYFTLATIGLDGGPRARVMLLPNIHEPHGVLSIATSKESSKWAELQKDPRFEIVFYFSHTKEQYRLRGNKVKFSGLEKEVWDTLADVYKQDFEKYKANTGKDAFGVIQFTPNLSLECREMNAGTVLRA